MGFKVLVLIIGVVSGYCFVAHGEEGNYRTINPKVEIVYDGDSQNVDFSECPVKIPVRVFKYSNGAENGSSLLSCLGKIDGVTYKLNYGISMIVYPESDGRLRAGKYFTADFTMFEDNGRHDVVKTSNKGILLFSNDFSGSATLLIFLDLPENEDQPEVFHSFLMYVTLSE